MDQPNKTGNHNNSINYIIGNLPSMISGACIGSGINPENFPSGTIIWQTTINIIMSSQRELDNS